MDSGRLKFENYKGVLYCEAYLDTEYTADDIKVVIDEIRENFTPPIDVIVKKVGSYSLDSDAQNMLIQNIKEIRNFIYVVDSITKNSSAEFAALTYMEPYNTRIASSKEEAYMMLMDS